jgi:hypothetical protein
MTFALLANISCFGAYFLLYLDPSKNVGGSFDYPLSTVFGAGIFSFVAYTLSTLYLIVMKFLRGYLVFVDINVRERLTYVMDVTTSLAIVFPSIFSGMILAISIFCVFDHGQSADTIAILILLLESLEFLYYALVLNYIYQTFLRELTKYLDQMKGVEESRGLSANEQATVNSVKDIYGKFKLVGEVVKQILAGSIPTNLVFMSWNFLRRKLMYLLMFQAGSFILTCPVITLCIKSFAIFQWKTVVLKDSRFVQDPQVVKGGAQQTKAMTSMKDVKKTVIDFKEKVLSSQVVPFSPVAAPALKHLNTFDVAQSEDLGLQLDRSS